MTITKNIDFVRKNFKKKIADNIDKIPMLKDFVAAYFCMLDSNTPLPVKLTIASALVYLISPIDTIPDAIAGLGYTDDVSVFIGAVKLISSHITDDHYKKAQQFIDDLKE